MKDLSRALRRHHDARLKKKRQYHFYGAYGRLDSKYLGRVLHTATICSCHMCGNPRRYYLDRSIQEKRWMQVVD